ncbi:minor capsid protein [Bacillus phage PK2]|nr:minor capsid protein [Bacillus phage PK2]
MNIPPVPTYKREIERLERVYKTALQSISKQLKSVEPEDLLRQEIYESQIRQITFILNDLNSEARVWIEETLTDAFEYSQASALVTMGMADTLVEAKGKLQFSLMARKRIEAMIDDTFEDILQAHSKMDSNLKKLVREVQADVLRQQIAMQRGTVTSAKELKTALIKEGFSKRLVDDNWVGVVDAGGKRWDLTTYTKMVARTKLQQTQIEGARIQALENDSDLAMISSHGAKDGCSAFEGIIVSLEGRTRGYRTLGEVRGSGVIFHPNCQHTIHPIGDIEALPKSLKDKAERQQKKADYAVENADEIKKQDNARRYREEKERREKLKEKRKKALEKAREARRKKRESR